MNTNLGRRTFADKIAPRYGMATLISLLLVVSCGKQDVTAPVDLYCQDLVTSLTDIQTNLDTVIASQQTNEIAVLKVLNQWLTEWDNGVQQMRVLGQLEQSHARLDSARACQTQLQGQKTNFLTNQTYGGALFALDLGEQAVSTQHFANKLRQIFRVYSATISDDGNTLISHLPKLSDETAATDDWLSNLEQARRARQALAELLGFPDGLSATRSQHMLPLNSAVADYLIQIEQKLVSIDDNQNLQTEVFNKDFGWPKVLQGLQQLSQSLFGLELLAADLRIPYLSDHLQPAQTFQVFENGQAVGELLIDLRWQTSGEDQLDYYVLGRGVRDLQIPRFLIVGKLIQPDAIERLSHDQLINMLHQFGHFLHQQMASEQAWFLNAGLSAEADFIEAPALLFEYWGWSPGGLELFLQTALGEDEISALKAKRDWRQQQITGVLFDFASAVEIQFSSNSSDASLADGSEIRLVDPEIVLSLGHRHCQLDPSHAYRCLLGAEIAAELVSGFEQFGFEDRQTASKLREQILNAGGSRPAIDMLSSFLNRSYSVNY